MGPELYGQLIFDKAGKNIQWKKDSLSNKRCWENWLVTCRMKLDHFLNTIHKNKFKMDEKDLNVRQENIKILEENIGSNLCDLGLSSFL